MPLLTKEDIQIILKQKLGNKDFQFVKSEDRSVSDISMGFLSSSGKITIIYKLDDVLQELHVFVKGLPVQKTQRNDTLFMGSFEKEPAIYNIFLSKYKNHNNRYYPECYLARSNDVVVLEDMTQSGYKNLPCLQELDVEHCKKVLDSVATLHAESLAFEILNNCKLNNYIPDLEKEHIFSTEEDHVGRKRYFTGMRGLQKVAEVYLPNFPEESVRKAFNFMAEFPHKLGPSDKFPNVISHSDLTNNNIMYKYNKFGQVTNACLLDFQCSAYRTPAFDVQMFIHCCTDRSFRMAHYRSLLTYYYEKLKNLLQDDDININSIMTWEKFDDMCRETLPLSLTMTIQDIHFVSMPAEVVKPILEDEERWRTYYQINKNEIMLQVMKSYPDYRKKIIESLTDLFEYFSDH